MKKLLSLTFISVCYFSISFGQSVVGKWTAKAPAPDGGIVTISASITSDGIYHMDFNQNGSIEVKGRYEVLGNQITIWDIEGDMACPPSFKGNYTLTFKNNQMTMTLVDDECEGRGVQELIWVKS